MELAPYFPLISKHQQVVKASTGHFPQPFLIRDVVRTAAKLKPFFNFPNLAFAAWSPVRFPLNGSITCFWNGFWQLISGRWSISTYKTTQHENGNSMAGSRHRRRSL